MVFLVAAVGYTATRDRQIGSITVTNDAVFNTANTAAAYGAVVTNDDADRESYIAAMKEKLARGAGKIPGAPVILTSVDEPEPPADTGTPVGDRSVQWCTTPQEPGGVIANWNPSSVSIQTVEGAHIVIDTSVSDGEETAAAAGLLIQLPTRPSRFASDTCLGHEVVGIALDGSLIRNDEAWRFSAAGGGALLGYALDGFPIYGPVGAEVPLDSCGGADTGSGYQYHVRTDEDFILGCFAGTPAKFVR